MAYIVGLISRKEAMTLAKRGWELEDGPKELAPDNYDKEENQFLACWIDASMYDIMSGPDWEK